MADNELLLKIGVQSDLRSLSSINSEFKKLEQGVKNLNNSMKTGGRSLDDYKNKSAMLQRQIELNSEKMGRLKTKISDIKTKMEDYQKQIDELSNSEEDNSKAIENLTKKYQTAAGNLNKTEVEFKNLQDSTKNLSEELENTNRAIDNFGLQKLSDKAKEAGEHLEQLGEKVSNAGETISEVGQGITNTFLPLASAGILAVKTAIDFESSWTSATKTIDGSETQLAALQEGLLNLSTQMPTNVNDLNELAAAAGQMGIGVEDIEDYVRVMAMLGETTNISADMATVALAQLLNITGGNVDEIENMGSAIVDLGNNFATDEATIVEFAQRIAGVGATAGISEQDILGFSAAMGALGINVEAGGTSFSTFVANIQSACSEGGDSLEKFAEVAGMSSADFKQAFEDDATGAIKKVLEGMHDYEEKGGDLITLIDEMGISETRQRDLLLRMAQGYDIVDEAISKSNSAWDENTALQDEAAKRYETVASQLEMFKNKVQEAGIKIGQALLPALTNLLDNLEPLIDYFSNLDPEVSATILKFGTLATAVGIGTNAFGKFVGNAGNLLSTVGKFTKGIGNITDMTTKSGKAISTLSSLTTNAIPALSGLTTTASGGASALGLLTTAALPVAGVIATAAAGIYAYHEYNEAMNESILKTTEEMSWLEEGFRKLNGVQAYSREELEELGLVYADFNENISEDFRNKVEEMTTDIHDFGMSIEEINIDGMITEEEANKVSTRVEEALNNCLTAIDSKNEEMQKGLAEAFNIDGVIDDNEKSLLEYWSTRGETERNEAINLQHEINDIIANARAEGRELTPEEEQAIMDYYAQIKQLELIAMADNSYELEYASQEFQNRMMNADAETAEKLLTQRHEEYQEQQLQTKTHYDTLIAQAKEGYDGLSEEEKRKVDETVQNLESAKQAALDGNTELYEADIAYAEEHCENLNMVWNKYRAEKVAAGDEANYLEYEQMREHYEGIEQITKSGYQKVYDNATGTWQDIYVSIDETTGELKGVYDLNTGNLIAMTEEDEKALDDERKAWEGTTEGIIANMKAQGYEIDELGAIYNTNTGEIIGKLVEVEDENGNLTQTICDVNGNPIAIKDNCGEVIRDLENTSTNVDNLDGKSASISVTTHYYEVTHQGLFSNTQKGYGYRNGQAGYYHQGSSGNLGSEQLAYINEVGKGSRSWELVDGDYQEVGRDSMGTKVLLGMGASVKSNVTSVEMMKQAVQEEVQKQLRDVYLDYGNRNSQVSQMAFRFGNPQAVFKNENNYDDSDLKSMLATLLGALIDKDTNTNIYLNPKNMAKSLTPYIDKELDVRSRRR